MQGCHESFATGLPVQCCLPSEKALSSLISESPHELSFLIDNQLVVHDCEDCCHVGKWTQSESLLLGTDILFPVQDMTSNLTLACYNITINDNDKRESPFRCQMTVSGSPHGKSHEEEIRGRSRVEICEDRPRRASRL